MIRIIIADDHAIVRSGLRQIFAMATDIVVVGEASQSTETLKQWLLTPCDLLLLDMTMPGTSGVDLIKVLHEERPASPILVLSMHNEGQIVARALKAGATGYVTKDSEPEVLLAAIRTIAAGGRFIDPCLVETMIFDNHCTSDFSHSTLSKREIQVLRMISIGSSLNAIANELHVSPKTVSTHKIRLMKKLGIENNADLIRYALQHELAST